ncbi:8110_t:CDS:2 [Funneliformis caledonium]|uniref:8110_t:CDS:1 n=1 Tax=Funneliformis caledonium TaxID=1117310 RepID=A0A9N9AF52_9GLOM|nr:8110_t:CDS:2 [Funneliformis caledonium]
MKVVPEARNIIIRFMTSKEGRNHKTPYSELSKKTGYSSKQIYHLWNDKLDPSLYHEPLSDEEKVYINKWVEENKSESGKIYWANCQEDMKRVFQRLHSRNKIKNSWYAEQKRRPDEDVENGADPTTQVAISTFHNDIRNFTQTDPTKVLTSTISHYYYQPIPIEPNFQPNPPEPPKFLMNPIF